MPKTTNVELKERIKELTCLYEVTSIIVNANYNQIDDTLRAIAFSLKKAFQFPEATEIGIETPFTHVSTIEASFNDTSIFSPIQVFNETKGKLVATFLKKPFKEIDFLNEERLLLDNVALRIGSFLEHVEIKQSEILFKKKMERSDRLAILGELTAGIAHELNTPLANILGFAELLKAKMEKENQSVDDLDKIINSAIFSREVVKKLMFFACEMPQEMKPVNLVSIVKDAINLLVPTFNKSAVKYHLTVQEEALILRADTVQLTQIVFNLLINAIYFSPKNGVVKIHVFERNQTIVLKISDEGKGLDEEALEKVFQPFFTTKPVGEGSGLGLSVVHGIVTSCKGSINVSNNRDKGATFEVILPK